jgi:hypothetical protein
LSESQKNLTTGMAQNEKAPSRLQGGFGNSDAYQLYA